MRIALACCHVVRCCSNSSVEEGGCFVASGFAIIHLLDKELRSQKPTVTHVMSQLLAPTYEEYKVGKIRKLRK